MDGPAWIVVPTYNEAANLEPLLAGVRANAPDARVLVVDDSSPDGTGALADHAAARDDAIEVLHRPGKAGLGLAYVNGFAHALRQGAGLVLGSRYVDGGGVEDWDLLRRVISRAGCRYARGVLGLGIRDLTGGFKCFRAATLRAIDFETVRSEGYAFQVELTYRTIARGLDVQEIPITFRDRSAGESKMSARIALEAIWLVPALRLARRRDGLPEAPGSGEPGTLPIPET